MERKKNVRRSRKLRGSFSLQAVFVTLGTALLVGLFANTVSYINVRNAVDQAARAVSRCLTPTDAGCAEFSAPPFNASVDWWGVQEQSALRVERFVSRYNYNGYVTQTSWWASYDWYEVHKLQPVTQLSLDRGYLVPVVGQLNAYVRRFVPIRLRMREVREVRILRPQSSGIFPRFNGSTEWSYLDVSVSEYTRRRRNSANPQDGVPLTPFQVSPRVRDIGSSETGWFVTNWVQAPNLPASFESAPCDRCALIEKYSARPGVSRSAPPSWRTHARVAIKAFADVNPVPDGSSAQIYWGVLPAGPGLILEITRAPRSSRPPSDLARGSTRDVPLGGRNWGDVSARRWFNLVLRGPAGAEGAGGDPKSPRDFHDNLTVPRGHWFRVRAAFSVRAGTVRVRPEIQYFVDSYTGDVRSSESEVFGVCAGKVPLKPGEPSGASVACPTLNECQYTRKEGSQGVSYRYDSPHCEKGTDVIEEVPSCDAAGAFPVPEGTALTTAATLILACSPTPAQPLDTKEFSAESGRLVCGTSTPQDITPIPVELGSTSSCDAGPPREVRCRERVTYREDGKYKNPGCAALDEEIRNINGAIDTLFAHRTEPNLRIARASAADASPFSYEELTPEEWQPQWLPVDENGDTVAGDRVVREHTESTPTLSTTYLRKDSLKPSLSDFALIPPKGLGSFPPGFLATQVRITEDTSKRNRVALSKAYPFANKPEIEIPALWENGTENFADFDMDCSLDTRCNAAGRKYSSKEEFLRTMGAREIPALNDPNVEASFSEEFVDIYRVRLDEELPACTPVQTLCERVVTQAQKDYLGRFSLFEYPKGPPICNTNTYSKCYHGGPISVGGDFQLSVSPDIERAVVLGTQEIRRLLPSANFNCSGPGCASIQVNSAAGARAPEITVSYNWPVAQPLAAILGTSGIEIRSSQSEAYELQ